MDQCGAIVATGTTSTITAMSARAFRMTRRMRLYGGKAYTTSECHRPQDGHRLFSQSPTERASTASHPGSPKRLQKRGARLMDTEANASTVTRKPTPATAA